MHGQWPSSPKAPSKKQSIYNIVALKAEFKRKEKIIKSFKSLTPSASLKQPYHPTIHHTSKESKQISLPGSTPHPIMTAPIAFAMVLGGAGAP
eukprot:12984197-Ditylum_brightwellii.AAC.1